MIANTLGPCRLSVGSWNFRGIWSLDFGISHSPSFENANGIRQSSPRLAVPRPTLGTRAKSPQPQRGCAFRAGTHRRSPALEFQSPNGLIQFDSVGFHRISATSDLRRPGSLMFGPWNFFGIWSLAFGIFIHPVRECQRHFAIEPKVGRPTAYLGYTGQVAPTSTRLCLSSRDPPPVSGPVSFGPRTV